MYLMHVGYKDWSANNKFCHQLQLVKNQHHNILLQELFIMQYTQLPARKLQSLTVWTHIGE